MPDFNLGRVVGEDGVSPTIDSSLDSESTNPVQNAVIKAALDNKQSIAGLINAVKTILYGSGYNSTTEGKYNFAITSKTKNSITYEDFWILINARYDYTNERFVKIDTTNTSFAIQLQANGTYPGEADLGYINTGINIWRNPKVSEVYKDTSVYDYTDFENNNWLGAKRLSDNEWVEFGISSGWNNNFMTDSYGGITVGGHGIEIDGNGLYPYARLTHSYYTDENSNNYAIEGLLTNAYHPSGSTWNCDNNSYYAWFFGFRTPIVNGVKDTTDSAFVIMCNDMSSITESNDSTDMVISDWEVVFNHSTSTAVDVIQDGNMNPVTSNAVYDAIGNIQEYVNR